MDTVAQLTRPLLPELPPFDPEPLRRPNYRGTVIEWLLTRRATMGLLRRFWPTLRVPGVGIRLISRFDDAQEALARPGVFQVPWAAKMQLLAPSMEPFVLATDDGAKHRCGQGPIMQVFRREDVPRIAAIAARVAERAVQGAAEGTLDAAKDLISKVPIEIYREYYGLDAPDELVLWLMAISNFTFRKIGPDPVVQGVALDAAPRVARIVDDAIERAVAGRAGDTIAARLVRLQRQHPHALPGDALRTALIGMTAGNVPVAAAAGGNILEVLLARPKAMAAARQAARDDDDAALTRCLLEALRFRPVNPGFWRICGQDYTLAAGTSRERLIRKDEKVLVFLQSAMQDSERVRHPGRFDPDRPPGDSMVFGYGMHWCVGAPLAIAQLTQTFKPLLLRGFRRAAGGVGRTRRFAGLPEHLTLTLGQR